MTFSVGTYVRITGFEEDHLGRVTGAVGQALYSVKQLESGKERPWLSDHLVALEVITFDFGTVASEEVKSLSVISPTAKALRVQSQDCRPMGGVAVYSVAVGRDKEQDGCTYSLTVKNISPDSVENVVLEMLVEPLR